MLWSVEVARVFEYKHPNFWLILRPHGDAWHHMQHISPPSVATCAAESRVRIVWPGGREVADTEIALILLLHALHINVIPEQTPDCSCIAKLGSEDVDEYPCIEPRYVVFEVREGGAPCIKHLDPVMLPSGA
mmetsp:Transcript_27323/g.88195  ORF Transcript_27323/g.88195 Transcript_27323/m.88195 type:complete len:132 (+) Transcript_27323:87-482(+)